MQVSILQGIYTDTAANFRTSLPVNMTPILGENGLSDGYLRTSPGLTQVTASAPGGDRHAIIWNNVHYRVMGTKLISFDGTNITILGDVGGALAQATMDYGFDRLAVCSGGGLYYWTGSAFSQVTDPNLGTPIDVCWIDGYFMLTDGSYLYVTELNSPSTILPTKYGSAEADPSTIVAVMRVRDEIYAITQYSIQNFQNVGGTGFPFQRNPGGLIPKGACGTKAVCYFLDTLAFVGSGRGEALSVYLAGYGQVEPISTPEVDRQLSLLAWNSNPLLNQQGLLEIEGLVEQGEQRLLVHLPWGTLVYHRQASLKAQKPIWSWLTGGTNPASAYVAHHFVWANNKWWGGSPNNQIGYLDETVQTQWGGTVLGQFDTAFTYNGGKGFILKSAELIGTPGLSAVGDPNASLMWTQDGRNYSAARTIPMGASGDTLRRLQWRPKTRIRQISGFRFQMQGVNQAAFARLEVDAEPLNV
jgi:hypothetical protein